MVTRVPGVVGSKVAVIEPLGLCRRSFRRTLPPCTSQRNPLCIAGVCLLEVGFGLAHSLDLEHHVRRSNSHYIEDLVGGSRMCIPSISAWAGLQSRVRLGIWVVASLAIFAG